MSDKKPYGLISCIEVIFSRQVSAEIHCTLLHCGLGNVRSSPILGSFPLLIRSFGPVSVVITTFDDAHYLREALASVAHQSVPVEIIVVDDGSKECPRDIVAEFTGARLIRKENGGLASARNVGLHASRSEYVAFLDADDRLDARAIEAGLRCFERAPDAAFVYGGHRRIDKAGSPLNSDIYRPCSHDPFADLLAGNMIGMHASVLYKREVLERIGGFDITLRRCEDYEVYLRIARDYRIASHAETIAEYRWHGENMSRDTNAMLRSVFEVHDRFQEQSGERRAAWLRGRKNWKEWYMRGQKATWDFNDGRRASVRAIARGAAFAARRTGTASVVRSVRVLRRLLRGRRWPPAFGTINFGDLVSTRPVSNDFGWERGTPIDRYYIERFLLECSNDIGGRVLEIGDDAYSRRFGNGRITRQDILHVDPANRSATLVGELTAEDVVPIAAFDCIVFTQTLQLIFELEQAVNHLHDALKPGGVLLLTVPGISQVDRQEWNGRWCWSFTDNAIRRLFERRFAAENVVIETHGNVFAATAYLTGAAVEEVNRASLDVRDRAYPVVVTMRARRA